MLWCEFKAHTMKILWSGKRSLLNLSMSSKIPRRHFQGAIYLQYGSERLLRVADKFPSQYMTSHAWRIFFSNVTLKCAMKKWRMGARKRQEWGEIVTKIYLRLSIR
jgi:hypothetical protein